MDALLWVALVPICLLVLYVIARLVSHAWFRSRSDYEERKQNHGRKTPR